VGRYKKSARLLVSVVVTDRHQYCLPGVLINCFSSSGRLGKWAYALVEYDLMYEPLRAMKGQVVADFIMDHDVQIDHEVFLAEGTAWQLFFDGFVYGHGQ
jgi:hypothetical protein